MEIELDLADLLFFFFFVKMYEREFAQFMKLWACMFLLYVQLSRLRFLNH